MLLFCLVAGISAALLMYQFTPNPLTVTSVVTLRYDIRKPNPNYNGWNQKYIVSTLTDLTAPDGSGQLDLNQITSSYVLQNALSTQNLSQSISLSSLRSNIKIEKILTEESRRQQELASSMMENTNTASAAYETAANIDLKYTNQFVVSLTNGFGGADGGDPVYLKDEELHPLLNSILAAYNDYLVLTYAKLELPEDEISIIDTEKLDILESLDLLKAAMTDLESYCLSQDSKISSYRSWQTGLSLNDLRRKVQMIQNANVNYLYSYVYTNSIVKDPEAMLTRYQYDLRAAETALAVVNENIETTSRILSEYKNDEIFVSMQESDAAKTTKTTTDYYNSLIIAQTSNYQKAADLEITLSDLRDKISNLQSTTATTMSETAQKELQTAITVSKNIYASVVAHMQEILDSAFYRNYV